MKVWKIKDWLVGERRPLLVRLIGSLRKKELLYYSAANIHERQIILLYYSAASIWHLKPPFLQVLFDEHKSMYYK